MSKQPEDLRAEIRDLIKSAGQADLGFYDALVAEYTDYILRLCEAAALAASPEKKSMHNMLDTKTAMPSEVIGHNQAVATYQANIHSRFGGSDAS